MSGRIQITEISEKRFNALAGRSRNPRAKMFAKEIGWFSNSDESIIGALLLDLTDDDYMALLLGKDSRGQYRCFNFGGPYEIQEEAVEWIHLQIKFLTVQGEKKFPQGDETSPLLDLFTPVVTPEKQHPYFTKLNSDDAWIPAKAIINVITPHFIDIDGNFVKEFQTHGFDARLWELYLDQFLAEQEFTNSREYNAPDFMVSKENSEIAIEAVIVGRKKENPPEYFKLSADLFKSVNVEEETKNAMPIRYGSPLYSKLKKKYWDLPHVIGKPLLFAIADFHDDQSMTWSSTALINYLYGITQEAHHDEAGNLIIKTNKIETHALGGKTIPSGFFNQPDTENVSGVLFSSSGTISKFNRMGRQAGFSAPNMKMIRMGTCFDHNPNSSVPLLFQYVVNEDRDESWSEGVTLFHNPKAKHKVDRDLFPFIAHSYYEGDQIVSYMPEFHPFSSITLNLRFGR